VHIISGVRERQAGLKAGALAYLEKPVTKEALDDSFNRISQFIDQQVKRLLVVEDDDVQRASMIELIAHEDVEITIIIYTGKELSQEEETRLRRFADTIIVKDVKSPERLLDETALFLHRVE